MSTELTLPPGSSSRHIAQGRPYPSALMLSFLTLAYMLSYFDRMLMVVLGESIKREFVLSDKELSLLTGASFVIMYGLLGVVAGWLLDRSRRERILACALALWSVMTMACGFAHSFVQLSMARAGVGIGEAASTPAGLSMLSDIYPPAKRPMATAIFFSGGMVGVLASFLIGSWLALHFGWRVAFFAAGPPGLVLALLAAFLARDPPREATHANASGLARHGSFFLVRTNKPLVWLLSAGAVSTFASVGMMQWLPMFFMRSHHLRLPEIGLFFGPVLASGMIGGLLLGGWLGNRLATRSISSLVRLCARVMFFIVPVYLVLLRLPSLPAALALTFFATGLSVVFTPVSTAAWQTICDSRARGTAAGISGFAAQMIGAAIGPFAVGALSDFWHPILGEDSLRYALMAAMVFCLLGAALFARSARLIERSGLDQRT
jgi:MFS family permease